MRQWTSSVKYTMRCIICTDTCTCNFNMLTVCYVLLHPAHRCGGCAPDKSSNTWSLRKKVLLRLKRLADTSTCQAFSPVLSCGF